MLGRYFFSFFCSFLLSYHREWKMEAHKKWMENILDFAKSERASVFSRATSGFTEMLELFSSLLHRQWNDNSSSYIFIDYTVLQWLRLNGFQGLQGTHRFLGRDFVKLGFSEVSLNLEPWRRNYSLKNEWEYLTQSLCILF